MGNFACIERTKMEDNQQVTNTEEDIERKFEQEKREINLVPKKRDFFNYYKFIHSKKKNDKHHLDMQYFNIKRAKTVNTKRQKTFLIKECRKFHLNKVIRQLTMNEVVFVQQISHINIHSPIEMFEEMDKLYMVYEELHGGSLLELLNQYIEADTRLRNEEIGTIVFQLAATVHFIHQKNYVHRDLKPENICFEKENDFRSLKLTSFLTVKKRVENEVITGINGSYLYMAPEMLTGENYSEKVDIWSLGVIMYMLCTLKHPIGYFDNEISRQNLKEKLIEKFKFVPRDELIDFNCDEFKNFSNIVPEVIKKMLEVNPKKRISARDVMNNKWVNENFKNYKRKLLQEMRKTNKNVQYNAAFLAFKAKKIKKALFSYFANILATAEDKEMFSEMFRSMDIDGDGVLTSEEFQEAMTKFNQIRDGENAKNITKQVIKKGQTMELHEFINSAIVLKLLNFDDQDKVLKQMFDALDNEQQGEIDIDDLVEIFKDQGLPDVYIQMIVDYCDQDKNNKINYLEFKEFILKEDQVNV